MKDDLQCTSKYGHLSISLDICHVRMTDFEGFLSIYGHSDNLLKNNNLYLSYKVRHVKYIDGINYFLFVKLQDVNLNDEKSMVSYLETGGAGIQKLQFEQEEDPPSGKSAPNFFLVLFGASSSIPKRCF